MAGTIQLYARESNGDIHSVEVDNEGTVDSVFQELIASGVDTHRCNLEWDGEILPRESELCDTGLSNEDVLDIVLKPVMLTWQRFPGEEMEACFKENNTVIINKNSGTKNWDAHTTPLIPLKPSGSSHRFRVQCTYEPSWTTSIGVTAEGIKAGRGFNEMAQVSIGEKGTVQWENAELASYRMENGSILDFVANSTLMPEGQYQVAVQIYVVINGTPILGKTSTFMTRSARIMLACYCYAPGQGWRIMND
eukprot:TRINITY_DN1943_c4_g1_i1.p1 TRINITY_DN1943_c4_g1~~TRINITY_DN1943_c4_g1_i1.p1  ORF type:complete len:250 (+),score=26.84 TRINITY_DN1943_c4_g1_i1:50-799(+)